MKANKILFGLVAAGFGFAGLTQSCVSDAPFSDGQGEGTLRMQLVVNSDVTRAQLVEDQNLADSCVVYISGPKGLLYNFKGIDNLPESIRLKSGNYVAEAWTGDSVTASFDKRFFRGYQRFSISQDNSTSVVVTCKIANVVVSIDHTTVDEELMKDWKITVSNSRGELVFDENNMKDAKGYFMMPNADIATDASGNVIKDDSEEGWPYYTNLNYRIEGKTASGKDFVKEGPICPDGRTDNLVQHAHEYRLSLKYDPKFEETGGSFVTIVVSEEEVLVKDEVGIYSRPAIKGTTFDIDRQLQGEAKGFGKEEIVKVSAFKSIEDLILKSEDFTAFGIDASGINLKKATEAKTAELKALGLTWDEKHDEDRNLTTTYLRFSSDYLNLLPEKESEYVLNIYVKDGYGRINSVDMRIAVGSEAVKEDDPITMDPFDAKADLLAVRAEYAVVSGTISADANDAQIRYRVKGSSDAWAYAEIIQTRATNTFTARLSNLKPGTEYEYQGVAGEYETPLQYITTETTYQVPNHSMEDWSTYSFQTKLGLKSDIPFPGLGSAPSFWSSGNAGSSMGGITLTAKSTDMKKSGEYSAKLLSQAAMGMLAAGNLFIGDFVGMPTLTTAEVSFGRGYTGNAHPDALSVWANYRPAQVSSAGQGLTTSMKDHGQIFVAFATAPFVVNTNTKTYFDPNAPQILGYGEITWAGEDFGPNGELEQVVIPIKWYDKAKTTAPAYVMIVASASKFGDYFVGGKNSVMYLDDFEFIYDLSK